MAASVPPRLGKYELLARIAKGGMAEIYLARQRGVIGFSRLVVVKRILPHLAEEPPFVRMFFEEARLAALINHPNVVRIYDVDHQAGSYYIAMEFIDGLSVSTLIKEAARRQRPLPCAVAAEIVLQACQGLHTAHELTDEQGQPLHLVHRDVSPHNLMVSRQGLVKLLDFGIAKAHDTSVRTRTGSIKGKYPYMSPEQCRGEALDRRTDIFSVGIIFFELLTGQRLFQRDSDLLILKAITEDTLPPLDALRPDAPEALREVVYRALSRDRETRFNTAAELADATRRARKLLPAPSEDQDLAAFLRDELGELLAHRARDIRRLTDRERSGGAVPIADGIVGGVGATTLGSRSGVLTPLSALSQVEGPVRRRRSLAWVLGGLGVAAVVALALWYSLTPTRPPGPALIIGMAPSFPERVVRADLRPLHRYLEQGLGRRLELYVAQDYRSLRQKLVAGELAFAHLPPLQYVLARDEDPGIRPLASHLYEGTKAYQGLIVARSGSGVQQVTDLKGKRLCYVDPGSTSGYLVPHYFIKQSGIDPDLDLSLTLFSGTHLAVMKDLIANRCDAGAISSGTLNVAAHHGIAASQIFHVAVTGLIPHVVIGASSRAPPEQAEALRQLLLDLDVQHDLGHPLVGDTLRISGFGEVKEEDFQFVEQAARAEGVLDP